MPTSSPLRALHGLLLVLLLVIPIACPVLTQWPFYLLVPLLCYWVVIDIVPALRRSCQWFAIGRFDRFTLSGLMVTAGLSSAALVLYQAVVHPDVTDLAARLPVSAFGNLLLAGICFAILNAVLEELIFRGVFYDAVDSQWGWQIAVLVTAAVFGVLHGNGYPRGVLGEFMAGIFGLLLGLLRWQTGGLALPIIAHICADATIFAIFVFEGAL